MILQITFLISMLIVASATSSQDFVSVFKQDAQQDTENRVAVLGDILSSLDRKYLSVALDTDEVRWKFKGFDFHDGKLQHIASGLAPAGMRLGGGAADFLMFDPDADEDAIPYPKGVDWERRYEPQFRQWNRPRDIQNFTMPGSVWYGLNNFTKLVGWDMMFDFNVLPRRADGSWDPSNAAGLLNYSTVRQIPIEAFQLGNEPDLFYHLNISIPGDRMAKDFVILKDLLNHYGLYHDSLVVGPDVTSVGRNYRARDYLTDFLKADGYKGISDLGLHMYYLSGETATLEDFLNPDVMDYMKTELDTALKINLEYPPLINIIMTETSSCYGGGSIGLSDRYVAGFLWLDKLGLSAQYGVKAVYRQSFFGGSYALISDDIDPRPDYYLSVLYKRLVEGPVFNISVEPQARDLRIYGNCARTDVYGYAEGAVVIYYLNVRSSNISLTLDKYRSNHLELFQLTPGDSDGLKSQFVKLNGQKLEMEGSDLPAMVSVPHQGDVPLPAQSFGFIVVPDAKEAACF